MIKFGTSGWRAIIGDEFTYPNVRLVSLAISEHLKETSEAKKGVAVGYDTRFMSDRFAWQAAAVLTREGIPVIYSARDVPTPVVSFTVIKRNLAGAINITASHNPPEYNGLKFSPSTGAPAPPEVTKEIEKKIDTLLLSKIKLGPMEPAEDKIQVVDFADKYLEALTSKIDINLLSSRSFKVAFNPLWGTGRGYVDKILRDAGWRVDMIHSKVNPLFGGKRPEPSEDEMEDFIQMVKEGDYKVGLATDGDADRFGIVDRKGKFISANYVLALIFRYLVEEKKLPGGAARSVATTHLLDRLAEHYNRPIFETPVGFKFIAEYILQDKIALGGEESAGLSIRSHVPEKDGIIACLLVAEMLAKTDATLKELIDDLFSLVGPLYSKRIGIPLSDDLKSKLPEKLKAHPDRILSKDVVDVVNIDGVKFILSDGSWLLFRPSGTEPLIRLYIEAESQKLVDELEREGKKLILG